MATLLAIADWSLRGALYQRAYALMEEGKLAMALSAMWVLEARDWSEPQAMTPLAATIEPLIKYLRSRITPREMSRAHDPDELARAFVDLYGQPSQYYQDFLST